MRFGEKRGGVPTSVTWALRRRWWNALARGFLTGTRTRDGAKHTVRANTDAFGDTLYTESADGIRGDTTSNVQKPAKLETGLMIQVPLFVKEGELVRVSTADGTYMGRA